jgi:hypothetical protein
MMDFDQRLIFGESDGKTNVKTVSTVSAKGVMMRSMFAITEMLIGAFQKQEEFNINNMKKVIDENTREY